MHVCIYNMYIYIYIYMHKPCPTLLSPAINNVTRPYLPLPPPYLPSVGKVTCPSVGTLV